MTRFLKSVLLSTAVACAGSPALAGDWEGPYVGAYGALVNGTTWYAGVQAGYNYDLGGGAYAGLEADGMYNFAGNAGVATVQGRLAYALSPDVLVYGQAGAGVGTTTNWWIAGVGGEVAVMNDVTLRVGVDRYDEIAGPGVNWAVKAGLGYRF